MTLPPPTDLPDVDVAARLLVPRSERDGAPKLPHWREGLRACLEQL